MIAKCEATIGITLAAGVLALGLASASHAQGAMGQTPPPSSPQQPAATTGTTSGAKAANSVALDVAPPVNAEEDAAFKKFQDTPDTDATQKIALGEAFEQKYPTSRYRPILYSTLTKLYLQTSQVQKMEEMGDKEVQLTPTDVQT